MLVKKLVLLVERLELLEYQKSLLEDDIQNLKKEIKLYTDEND